MMAKCDRFRYAVNKITAWAGVWANECHLRADVNTERFFDMLCTTHHWQFVEIQMKSVMNINQITNAAKNIRHYSDELCKCTLMNSWIINVSDVRIFSMIRSILNISVSLKKQCSLNGSLAYVSKKLVSVVADGRSALYVTFAVEK